ncbi:MAG: hypothetical protein ACRERD_31585, partial [Candidatus Binatia bacterium]
MSETATKSVTATKIETMTQSSGETSSVIERKTEVGPPTLWESLKRKGQIARTAVHIFVSRFQEYHQPVSLAFVFGVIITLAVFRWMWTAVVQREQATIRRQNGGGAGNGQGRKSDVVFVILGWVVNYNKSAPHYFYRDRLLETYLRTEVDNGQGQMELLFDAMEMPLTHLHGTTAQPGERARGWTKEQRVWGCTAPYQLIGTAINLPGSRDLTRKDRKSGYFLFSKLYCGSAQTDYRPTEQYYAGETKLSRALTISGAAASSAIGYATFFAQAFALTLFNIRLGYWMANPERGTSLQRYERKSFWPIYLLREMFAKIGARSDRLVNLSDGGHTGDNVGIYPLLERRCKIIIACDAECDTDVTFGSFTQALRHAYID